MQQDEFENEIQAKGLTAPRVTPADLEDAIVSEVYFTGKDGASCDNAIRHVKVGERPDIAALGLLTFCVLILRNGFTVVGKSACASPENFDAELGRKIARQDAVSQMWPLLGFALKERLHKEAGITDTDRINFMVDHSFIPLNAAFFGLPDERGETPLFQGADAIRANLDRAMKKYQSGD